MTIKKIVYALFVVLVIGILANIGYHIGEEWRYSQGGLIDPTFVQSFLAGPDKIFDFDREIDPTIHGVVFTFLGIPVLIIITISWIVYFLFFGELFRFIGIFPSILASLASIVIVVLWLKRKKGIAIRT